MDEPNPSNEDTTRVIKWDVNTAAIAEVAKELKDIDAYKDLDAAKKAKKQLTKMRTTLKDAHAETKSEALAFGRVCDAKKNEYMALIKAIEDPISEDLEKIKNAAAVAEEERVAKIMAEIERIQAYALDRHSLTLEEMNERLANLREQEMDAELLEEFFDDWGMAQQEGDLKLRLAIDAETTRLAEVEAAAKLAEENKELRDKLLKSQEAEDARLDKAKEEQDEKDRAAKVIRDKETAAQKVKDDARQKELDDQQDEIDRQTKEREDAEQAETDRIAQEKADEEAAKITALQAPDIDKLTRYAEEIGSLIRNKPVMGSNAGHSALLDTVALLINSHEEITQHIEELK